MELSRRKIRQFPSARWARGLSRSEKDWGFDKRHWGFGVSKWDSEAVERGGGCLRKEDLPETVVPVGDE